MDILKRKMENSPLTEDDILLFTNKDTLSYEGIIESGDEEIFLPLNRTPQNYSLFDKLYRMICRNNEGTLWGENDGSSLNYVRSKLYLRVIPDSPARISPEYIILVDPQEHDITKLDFYTYPCSLSENSKVMLSEGLKDYS